MIIDFLKEKKVVVFYIIFTVIWNWVRLFYDDLC